MIVLPLQEHFRKLFVGRIKSYVNHQFSSLKVGILFCLYLIFCSSAKVEVTNYIHESDFFQDSDTITVPLLKIRQDSRIMTEIGAYQKTLSENRHAEMYVLSIASECGQYIIHYRDWGFKHFMARSTHEVVLGAFFNGDENDKLFFIIGNKASVSNEFINQNFNKSDENVNVIINYKTIPDDVYILYPDIATELLFRSDSTQIRESLQYIYNGRRIF